MGSLKLGCLAIFKGAVNMIMKDLTLALLVTHALCDASEQFEHKPLQTACGYWARPEFSY
jgi:hypothetical protein